MTEPNWDPRTCNERSGFLFQHDCSELPQSNCAGCGKPVCAEHTHHVDNEPFCTGCAKQDYKQRRRQSRSAGRGETYEDDDDPYFYGERYYDGYGRYRPGYWGYAHYSMWTSGGDDDDLAEMGGDDLDFTAGDADSLSQEGDGDFETDMSES